jgi:hypothetical protein
VLKATDAYLFRVAQMLDDFAVHGGVLRRYSRTVDKLTADQAERNQDPELLNWLASL